MNENPNGPYASSNTDSGGCGFFVLNVIGGFMLFLVIGFAALGMSNGKLAVPFLIVASGSAVFLSTRPKLRGLAVGVFLGLGACLLLIAMCSGFRIGG